MPELPEVESVRRQLAPELLARRIADVWWDASPHARISDLELCVGRRVEGVRRRGKFLLCDLDPTPDGDRLELVLHLGLTGSLSFGPRAGTSEALDAPVVGEAASETADGRVPVEAANEATDDRHVRVRFDLDDGRTLRFRDPRRFGRASVVPAGDYVDRIPTLATLGPEPLAPGFGVTAFAAGLARGSAPVKARLLDQRLVAGIGNIYADEALWRARIHPASRRVGRARAAALHAAIVEVLTAAVEREGTTFRDYRMVNGTSGRYAEHLDAYGRSERPCRRCGEPLRRTTIAQRGTTFCARCQRH